MPRASAASSYSPIVDDNDSLGISTTLDELVDGFGATGAVPGDDDVTMEMTLDDGHAPLVPNIFEQEVIRRPQKDDSYKEPDRCDDERVEHARLGGHGHDVAIADGSDRDHREVEHIEEADRAVDVVAQPITVEPVTE